MLCFVNESAPSPTFSQIAHLLLTLSSIETHHSTACRQRKIEFENGFYMFSFAHKITFFPNASHLLHTRISWHRQQFFLPWHEILKILLMMDGSMSMSMNRIYCLCSSHNFHIPEILSLYLGEWVNADRLWCGFFVR